MARLASLGVFTVALLLANGSIAGEKKPAARSLAAEAALLAGKAWISENDVSAPALKLQEGWKAYLTLSFAPEAGKGSGKAQIGFMFEGGSIEVKDKIKFEIGGRSGASVAYSFELIEQPTGQRQIKFTEIGGVSVSGKPVTTVPRMVNYVLDGEKLTIWEQPLWWAMEPVKIKLRREK